MMNNVELTFRVGDTTPMIGENRQLVTDELVEFEN